MADNIFEQTRDALKDLDTFLSDEKVIAITTALDALLKLVETFVDKDKINDALDSLVGLLGQVKAEIEKLDPSKIDGLDDLSKLAERMKNFITALKGLLPDADLGAADGLAGILDLEPLTKIRDEILGLIESVSNKLKKLKI